MSLSPFFDTIRSLHSNTMSLSPFDIKGKGRTKTNTRFFFSSCRRKCSTDLMYTEVTMLPLSSCWTYKHIFQWSTWLYDLPITNDSYLHQRSIQVDLHKRLKYPTTWVYTSQLNYPTKWVYKFYQVLTWVNITILQHRSQHDLFIKWVFIKKNNESQSCDQTTKNT